MTPKQRFMIMIGVDAICVMVALAAIVAHATYHQPIGLPLFAAAILIGFGVQIWFIVSLAKAMRIEKGA